MTLLVEFREGENEFDLQFAFRGQEGRELLAKDVAVHRSIITGDFAPSLGTRNAST